MLHPNYEAIDEILDDERVTVEIRPTAPSDRDDDGYWNPPSDNMHCYTVIVSDKDLPTEFVKLPFFVGCDKQVEPLQALVCIVDLGNKAIQTDQLMATPNRHRANQLIDFLGNEAFDKLVKAIGD